FCRPIDMQLLKRFLKALPWMLISPVVMVVTVNALAATDLLWKLMGRTLPNRAGSDKPRNTASVVILNWNAKDLLEKYLPSVIQAMQYNELIAVDNGATDDRAELVRRQL